jgi:Siphovirus Gp157
MKFPILNQLHQYEHLREQLETQFPEIDDETLADTLEGLSTLPEALAAVMRSYLDDLALASALGIRIGEMQARLSRIEQRADRKRSLSTYVMDRTEIKKIEQPDFTASLRVTPRQLIIHDEKLVPEAFWVPQPPKLDRRRLSAALAADPSIPGATLGNGGTTISVRTK